jgi:hypothetical protein
MTGMPQFLQTAMAVVPALLAGIIFGLLIRRGYSIRPTKLSLFPLEVLLERFESLPPVEMFLNLSMVFIEPSAQIGDAAKFISSKTPVALIHAGWNIVCEAFIRRFKAYPTDDRIDAVAAEIGGQNVEFIKMYRDIHVHAIRHANTVTHQFASNYLIRAPSLAERIEPKLMGTKDPLLQALLSEAARTIRQSG